MNERAFLVAGLGLGDEGKGSIVDWLVRDHGADTVIRYNGGAQAAHHVVTDDGREHCFAQFGAGTLVPGVRTFLSRFVIVDLLALAAEEQALRTIGVQDAYSRLTLDPRCVLVTPFHRMLNHMRELARGGARHGSCGMGIGEARLDAENPGLPTVIVADALEREHLRSRLRLLWLTKLDQAEQLVDSHSGGVRDQSGSMRRMADILADLRRPDRLDSLTDAYHDIVTRRGIYLSDVVPPSQISVFEGAQGVLLDRSLGFWPHVTPSRTTLEHAETLLAERPSVGQVTRVGVLRAYATRHGAGPLVTEDRTLSANRPDQHNGDHAWQGHFRLGWFDAVAARHALRTTAPIDRLVMTNLDRLTGLPRVRICTAYRGPDGALTGDIPTVSRPEAGDARRPPVPDARTRWLLACRPHYRDLPGWQTSPPAGTEWRDAIAALEAASGCGRPIDAISMGPTARDKLRLTAW